ncbi:putative thymidylate kinase [Candidatus Methanoplasma termitum]|uniref:Probable thymidylate kinase n=1 Tax=Candidatus Methanoplasma termitum TaxID=1577791 RepID=A0A0A7LDF9_9ARCH|nr:dTMP kinase [Candidatus Methanoplasma termitum]AIZ57200.1 putative thymidylate kinase [Candidatus Methanoplasma termitum]MCL2334178.1 dTMP kinase [Candidatus Methanoplasma sp.]
MNDEERLAEIEAILEELKELSADHIILVEGIKDKKALRRLGINRHIFMIQAEAGPIKAAEYVSAHGKKAIILTDWDHKGGVIAHETERQLASLDSAYNTEIRAKLSHLCKKYIKDVESLDTLVERLSFGTSGIKSGYDTVTDGESLKAGAFLVIEGIDGAGKSTLCGILEERLTSEGYSVKVTQEPTHDEIGSVIRGGKIKGISQKAEALLFTADRAVHTQQIIEWVFEGLIVICDRYFASTVAYQSSGLNGEALDREWLISLNKQIMTTPDLTVLLDIDAKKSLSRIGDRDELSKYEQFEYLDNVRREYLRLADEFDFMVIDAEGSQAEIASKIIAELKEIFSRRRF